MKRGNSSDISTQFQTKRLAYFMSVGSDRYSKRPRESKVSEFDASRCIKKKILRLEISMQDTMTMADLNAL